MAAGALFAAGLLSYELGAYHLAHTRTVPAQWIPVLLAFATGCGVIVNLVFGRLYDRYGMGTVVAGVILSAAFAPVLFQGDSPRRSSRCRCGASVMRCRTLC